MRNPNETSTTIRQTSTSTEIIFNYTSASVAQHDLEGVKNSYATANEVVLVGKTITVRIPLQ
jgi:hypothetical protein